MALLPIQFVVEETGEIVELAEHDLPEDIPEGIKRLRTVTRYAGDHVSVQVHGLELKPIKLSGTIDDTWWGIEGHAAAMAENLRTIAYEGQLIRFEYDDMQLWGIIDVELTRRTAGWYTYEIGFEPFWRQNPSLAFVPLALPEAGSAADWIEQAAARAEELRARVVELNVPVAPEWLSELTKAITRASALVSDALAPLRTAARWADMTADQVARARAILPRAIGSYQLAVDRIQGSTIEVITESPIAALLGYDSAWEIERAVQARQAELYGLLRRLIEIYRPLRSRTHVVGVGETLVELARRYLGDYSRWVEIADLNDLASSSIAPGQVLDIPARR